MRSGFRRRALFAFLAYAKWSIAPLISPWTDRALSVAGTLCFLFLARKRPAHPADTDGREIRRTWGEREQTGAECRRKEPNRERPRGRSAG